MRYIDNLTIMAGTERYGSAMPPIFRCRVRVKHMTKMIDKVRRLLREDIAVDTVEGYPERDVVRALNMLTHDGDDIVRQRACRELGRIISRMQPEKFDNFIRRLLWRLNPEAGDYPIGVPELLGEIGNRAPERIESFVPVILYYFEDENLLPGLLQAAGRIGQKIPGALSEYIDEIAVYLSDERAAVAGNAALALCRIGGVRAEESLRAIGGDKRKITLRCGKKLLELSLGEVAGHCRECESGLCFIANRGRT